jgi:hypothetical protein
VYSKKNHIDLSNKRVEISVYNRDKTYFLKEEHRIRAGFIDAKAVWNKFSLIELQLIEGFPYDEGEKVKLLDLKYKFNDETNQFERTN